MARKIDPTTDGYFQVVNNVVKQVKEILAEGHSEKLKEGQGMKTVFHELRDGALPPEERTSQRLVDDGMILLGAGTETTAGTLYVITYYLLSQKETLARLREDLRRVIAKSRPKLPSLPELENLDYLRAVILEGIRMHRGSCIPLLRTAPNETLRYKEWVMPPGTEFSAGSTGNLGTYLLDCLLRTPGICKITCLNRSPEASERQASSHRTRGLLTISDSLKVNFVQCDLSQSRLGMAPQVYANMTATATHLIHIAWSVSGVIMATS